MSAVARPGIAHRRPGRAGRCEDISVVAVPDATQRGDDGFPSGPAGTPRLDSVCGRSIRISRGDGPVGAAAPGGRQRGYTLLEVVVAFSILAVALTVLLGALSGGTRQVRWSADAGRAALLAQSLLDQTGVGEVLQPGRNEGDFEDGRYRWSLEVEPYVDRDRPPSPVVDAGGPQLLRLQLTVTWGEGGPRDRLQLSTLRLVQPGVEGGLF